MRRRVVAALLVALALAGCGDDALWARYRAEKDVWRARRVVQRLQINPQLARPQDYREAIEAFSVVERRFPLSEWGSPGRLPNRRAREVATLAGDALIATGRLEEAQSRFAAALEVYRRAARALEGLPAVRTKALQAEALLLDRTRDSTRAHDVYAEIARSAPPVDPDLGEPVDAGVDAALRVAATLRARGRVEAADSTLRAVEERFVAATHVRRTRARDAELWLDVGRLRAARPGALDGAMEAVRHALGEAPPQAVRARLVLALADFCFAGGRPDSALTYTTWGARFGGETKAKAMTLAARVWETVDLDSAIVAYDRYIEAFRRSGPAVMPARFRRAELLERRGRWESARAEFRALATSSATDTLALRSLERIVTHHLQAGEKEMGRIEAKRALEALDHLLTTVQDDDTLLRIRQLRARLLVDIESWDQACAALEDLWTHYGHQPLGVQAGFRAAELAERELKDLERARRLYEKLATDSSSPVDQEMARRQLDRLRHERS